MADRTPSRRRRPSADGLERKRSSPLPYVALLGAVLAILAALLTAPQFLIAQPNVVGQRLVQPDAIAQASGLAGKSIFLVDAPAAERAVLDLRPIESAHVAVSWPNVVTISVVERQRAAVWRSGGGAWFVSPDGIVLGEASGDAPPLAIADLDARRVFVGGKVDREVISRAAALRDGLRDYLPAGPSFDLSKADGLATSLVLPGPKARTVRVLFGDDGDVSTRLETWQRLEPDIASGKLKAEVVDLRILDRPFVR